MKTQSPAQSIKILVEGNKRFIGGVRSVEPLLSHLKMGELATRGQNPFAIVLTCSDSRVPVEMIFDQGLGDLFVIRVAGNVVAPSLLASIEYAAANCGSSVVVVLGHTLCGAVKATIQHVTDPASTLPSSHLEELVGRIRPAVEATQLKHEIHSQEFSLLATIENIHQSVRQILKQSQIISDLVNQGKLSVEPAILDIATGKTTFLAYPTET